MEATAEDTALTTRPPPSPRKQDTEAFTHRTGRTGRAGKAGTAIAIVAERELGRLRGIERETGAKVTLVDVPTTEDVMAASAEAARLRLGGVEERVLPYFEAAAESLIAELGPTRALAAALATLSGFKTAPRPRSLLSHEPELRTVRVTRGAGASARLQLVSPRDVMSLVLRTVAGEPRLGKIRMLESGEGAVFDVPHDVADALVAAIMDASAPGLAFDLPIKLPALAPEAVREYGGGRFGGGGGSGGYRSGGGGGG